VDILEIAEEENTVSAILMGYGKTRRIAFSDTLLGSYASEEIKVLCAHELGHVKKAHFMKTWLSSLLIIMLVLFLTNLLAGAVINFFNAGDIATLSAMPITVLVFFILYSFSLVASNFYSRSMEREADLYSLQLTQNPQAFISMLQKITDQNLDEENPYPLIEKLMYDHPSSLSRREMAEHFMQRQNEKNLADG
jgi:Zn-dependent protease with chaperone function